MKKTEFPHKAHLTSHDSQIGIRCRCDEFNAFGSYGLAQMAMGHTIERNCKCGLHVEVQARGKSHVISAMHEGHIFKAGSVSVDPNKRRAAT